MWRSKKVTARLHPGCNTRGKMTLLINVLSFRNQYSARVVLRSDGSQHQLRFCGGRVIRFKFRELRGEIGAASDTTDTPCVQLTCDAPSG